MAQDTNQMNISYELLMLLHWLLEHEQDSIKKLVGKSLQAGLQKQLDGISNQQERQQAAIELQDSIIDFFILLENQIHDVLNEDHTQEIIQRNILPALKQVDMRNYSLGAVETSIAKAQAAYSSRRDKTPKEILCKELLKRWKPGNKKSAAH